MLRGGAGSDFGGGARGGAGPAPPPQLSPEHEHRVFLDVEFDALSNGNSSFSISGRSIFDPHHPLHHGGVVLGVVLGLKHCQAPPPRGAKCRILAIRPEIGTNR